MSGFDKENAFISGQPGTTGREPFEEARTGDFPAQGGQQYSGLQQQEQYGAGQGLTGAGIGRDNQYDQQQGQGLTGAGVGRDNQYDNDDNDRARAHDREDRAGSGYDSTRRVPEGSGAYESDRVGARNEQAHLYERTGADGPITHGAAGTDRFDSDRKHGNAASGAGFGPGGEKHTEYGGNTAEGYGGENDVDKREKAEGTGGVGGLLTTTDKEFTGRDRLGGAGGAYGDEKGHFEGNTSGPNDATALTGREGTYENNPVAKEQSKVGNEIHPTRTENRAEDTGERAHDAQHGQHDQHDQHGEKKGMMQKIKDALH